MDHAEQNSFHSPTPPTQHPAAQPMDGMGLDLDSVTDLESGEFQLVHPKTGLPTGAFILLAGPEHPERRKKAMNITRAVRASYAKNNRMPSDPEDEAAEMIETLTMATLGWRGITRGGQPLPFSKQAARDLYADAKSQWVVVQITTALGDRAVFIKA